MDLTDIKNLVDFDRSIVDAMNAKAEEKKKMSEQINIEKEQYRKNAWEQVEAKLSAKRVESSARIERSKEENQKAYETHKAQLDQTFSANKKQWIESITKNIFE